MKNIYEIQSFRHANGLRKESPAPVNFPAETKPKEEASGGDNATAKFESSSNSDFAEEKRSLRPRKKIDYTEEIVPNEDDFIFCEVCGEDFFEGCSLHPAIRNDDPDLVVVGPSTIKDAGRGVFNKSPRTIPVGTLFGPYKGEMVSPADYERKSKSGYAWQLRDPQKTRVVGYVDPGFDPDPAVDWLSIVNSANRAQDQNVLAVQLKGQIMYSVCRPIPPGTELLTYYGDDYARAMNIDPLEYRHGGGRQEHSDKISIQDLTGKREQ